MSSFRARLEYILKHSVVINAVFRFCASSFLKFCGLFLRMDEKGVLFSAHGRKYNDSPRCIYEYMIAQPKFKDFHFYWALERPEAEDIPGKCTKIKADTFKYFLTALKCKYWVTCVNIERSLRIKKRRTIYLNTWHGIPIKTVGNEAAGRKDYDFSYLNYFCISGTFEKEIYRRSFCVTERQLLKTGMPRNDFLYHVTNEQILQLKEKLGLPSEKKVILYAPTWRDSKDGGKTYAIRPPMNLEVWRRQLGEQYVILFRTHPYTTKLLNVTFDDFVLDFSNYPSINELMAVSDILISDYSATIFDFSILERPIICFAYDLEEYRRERGFVLNVEEAMPSGIARSEQEVLKQIQTMDYASECAKTKAFKEKYMEFGGNATSRCVETVFGLGEKRGGLQ